MSGRQRVLLTGATGLLAPYLATALSASAEVVTTARRGGDVPCELAERTAVAALVDAVGPDVVVHAAALTDVDACEACPGSASRANVATTANLAETVAPHATLVVVSTDQVYPATPGLHEEKLVGPVNVYGRTKLAAELAAGDCPTALVLRVNFFGPSLTPGRRSLSDVVVDRLASGAGITGFGDMSFSPLHMGTLADVLTRAITAGLTGTYNLGGRAGCSKLDFARAVARHHGMPSHLVRPGLSSDQPGRAPRPPDVRMDVSRIEAALGITLPMLEEEVAKL